MDSRIRINRLLPRASDRGECAHHPASAADAMYGVFLRTSRDPGNTGSSGRFFDGCVGPPAPRRRRGDQGSDTTSAPHLRRTTFSPAAEALARFEPFVDFHLRRPSDWFRISYSRRRPSARQTLVRRAALRRPRVRRDAVSALIGGADRQVDHFSL